MRITRRLRGDRLAEAVYDDVFFPAGWPFMTKTPLILALLLLALPASAQSLVAPAAGALAVPAAADAPAVPLAGSSGRAMDAADIAKIVSAQEKAAIDSVIAALTKAANTGDMELLADVVAADLIVTTLDGQRLVGLDEFAAYWKGLTGEGSKQPVRLAKVEIKPDLAKIHVSRPAPDVVMIEAPSADEYTAAGADAPLILPTRILGVFTRQADGSWKLSRLTSTANVTDNALIDQRMSANNKATIGAALAGLLLGFLAGRLSGRRLYSTAETVDRNPPKATAAAEPAPPETPAT